MAIFKVLQNERLASKAGDKLVKFYLKDIATGERSEVLKNNKAPYNQFQVGDFIEDIQVDEVLNADGTIKLNKGIKYVKADMTEVSLILAGKVRNAVGEGQLAVQTFKSITTTVGRVDAPITVGEEDVLAAFK